MDDVRISKFMSLVLRHQPEALGVTLDPNGWTALDDFTRRMNGKFGIGEADIRRVVETNAKQRFVIRDGRIRANQGHSVEVDLQLRPAAPPRLLYHGTTRKAFDSIMVLGLIKGERRHVHLSEDIVTAEKVSTRRSGPWIVLAVETGTMHAQGIPFFRSENNVWLTDTVAPEFLSVAKEWSSSGDKP
ncbi:MAG: RNA 2'-phosphotransferase [Parvibaculaceae bacterium]